MLQSLDFAVSRFSTKSFKASDIEMVHYNVKSCLVGSCLVYYS